MTRTIPVIDKEISAVRAVLLRFHPVQNPLSSADWQQAWDAQPQLAARNTALWKARGAAQLERDHRAHEAAMKATPRLPRAKTCPTCRRSG